MVTRSDRKNYFPITIRYIRAVLVEREFPEAQVQIVAWEFG